MLFKERLSTSVWYYKHVRRDDGPLRQRIRNIAEARVRYGIERNVVLLKREGWKDNHKRVYRIYREDYTNVSNIPKVEGPICKAYYLTVPRGSVAQKWSDTEGLLFISWAQGMHFGLLDQT